MPQQATIYLFLSPLLDEALGENGKQALSKEIKEKGSRYIKGLAPHNIEIVPQFSVMTVLEGYQANGYITFSLYQGVSADMIKPPLKDAVYSATLSAGNNVGQTVRIDYGGIFTIYE